jgi:FkbM family methyltransferase
MSTQTFDFDARNAAAYRQFFLDGPWQIEHKVVHDPDYLMLKPLQVDSPLIFDVGANKGQSIASLLTLFPNATIHAFECNPAMVAVLRNLKEKKSTACRNVVIHDCGLSNVDGELTFSIPVVDGTLYFEETTSEPEVEFKKHAERYKRYGQQLSARDFVARVIKGDSLLLKPDIVKIDAEGSEPKVILGLIETIRSALPVVLAETSCFNEVNALLFPLGYRACMPADDGKVVPLTRGRANALYVHPKHSKLFAEGTLE